MLQIFVTAFFVHFAFGETVNVLTIIQCIDYYPLCHHGSDLLFHICSVTHLKLA